MTVCSDVTSSGSILCLHAGRMPMAEWVVAGATMALGDHMLRVVLAKVALFLLPLWAAMEIVWRSAFSRQNEELPLARRLGVLALLLVPFVATPFLADVVNLQVEEGYSYSYLALIAAMLFFPARWVREGKAWWPGLLLFIFGLDGLLLSKSSTIVLAVVLLAFALRLVRPTFQRIFLLVAVLLAPVAWGLHVRHVSHHFSVGTSYDGINFHKGNNADFLRRYPPPSGETLDRFDQELNGSYHFEDEWQFDAFHRAAALKFLEQHPADDLRGWWRKLDVLLFSLHKTGSARSTGAAAIAETGGVLLMRLALWSAFLVWMWFAARDLFLYRRFDLLWPAMVLSTIAPYLAGFGYTRHASVLMYPAVLLLCRHILSVQEEDAITWSALPGEVSCARP